MMVDQQSNERDMLSLCITCADQLGRDQRDTPLGGVTVVTLVELFPTLPKEMVGPVRVGARTASQGDCEGLTSQNGGVGQSLKLHLLPTHTPPTRRFFPVEPKKYRRTRTPALCFMKVSIITIR
jgi:hypothetical protein